MNAQAKPALIALGIVAVVSILTLWLAVSATVAPVAEAPPGSRLQALLEGADEPTGPVVVCSTRIQRGFTLFECEADSWGRWEIFWANPDTLELTFLEGEGHNKSFGKNLTTNPGELVVKFRDSNGIEVVKAVAVISDLQLCNEANQCYRV